MSIPSPRLAGLAAVLLLASCSPIQVSQDYDTSADFGALKRYAWFTQGPKQPIDTLTAQRITRAVDEELGLRGFVRSEPEAADFLVNTLASLKHKVEVRPNTLSVGYGWGRGGVGVTSSGVSSYDEGTLVLDFISPKTQALVWRGVGRGAANPNLTPEERDERIREAVRKILDQFPPRR